jgi:short-subunit dehydrogenase
MGLKVFITGASSGIGEALARQYAADGATLGLVARRMDVLEQIRSSLASRASTSIVEVYAADVTDSASLARAGGEFIARHGAPDIVIACAGISIPIYSERAEDLPAFKQVLDTNVFGTISTFQPFIAAMKAHGGGALVGISSVAGVRGLPGASAYCASKAAVISYCESLRVELLGSGVKVLTICPGYVRTQMTAGMQNATPFMIDAPAFAARATRAIAVGASYTVIPWQMGWIAKLLRLLPNWLYDPMMKKARPKRVSNP